MVDVRSLPASGGFVSPSSLLHSRVWHCKKMRTEKTREWAFGNHGAGQRNRRWKDGLLTQGEVQWIMDEEDNATLLIKYCPATGGKSPRSLIRQCQCITQGELFGEFNLLTNEWADGIVPYLWRGIVKLAAEKGERHWLYFDGPIDTLWIESMNTVLDDNRMLCLANSERIKMPPGMHMMFEVQVRGPVSKLALLPARPTFPLFAAFA